MYIEQYHQLNRRRLDWQTEEEVRLGWLTELQNTLSITFHAERGRSDADYNQVIIEFKNVGLFHGTNTSPKFREAMEELSRYITAKAHSEGIGIQNYQGIAIDGESIAFAYIPGEGENIVSGPIMPLSPDSVQMVFEACRQSSRRALTATNLIEDFGHGSVTGGFLMQALSDALVPYLDEVDNSKIKMLYQEWKALYGQVADLSSSQVEAIMRTIGFMYNSTVPDKLSRILFVIHTFDSIIIKLLAAEIVAHATELTAYTDFAQNSISVDDERLIAILDDDIEHSQLYARANIHGFVEEPLFSWYIDVCKTSPRPDAANRIVRALRDVLIRLSFYQMEDLSHAQTNDVLKRFYQNIVPQVLRKSLGEFYTPDWLVEVSLDKVEGEFDELKFLDPTCGSASFLLAIIKRIRECSTLSESELLQRITQNVWGFDLNPLAVQTARVNYLIAISDLIAAVPGIDIEIPILLADAIYSPAPDPEGDVSVVNYVIGSSVADLTISLPAELAQDRERLDKVFSIMGECVEQNMEAASMLSRLTERQAISDAAQATWETILSTTYERVLDLHRRNWNGIWFRIVRNYFWSATAGEFDVIVGNPPWVRWSKLPELYRNRVMPTCRRYDIFSHTPFYGGNELDISGLITYTVSDKWLKNGGQLIFLLTQTHFQSASSEGFRRFCIDGGRYLSPVAVDDLKSLKPFPDAANKTVVFVARKSEDLPNYPVDYVIWNSMPGNSRILFEGKSIKQFNTAMFLESLKALQSDEFFPIVQLRWQAIQAYFLGDVAKCVEHLESALKLAKETNQPTWVIKDLLVDRRNQHWTLCTVNNQYFESEAQKELTESDEELYYPLLDRIHESLHEKYIEGFYKKKTESPYSVTIGGNLDSLGELLASSFVISMYNGSLSHILLFYEKLRDFVFYLSNKYSDWQFRRLLLQFAVFAGKEKEIKGLKDSYPEILNQLTADDAIAVMDFCNNHPMKHKRISSQLLGFGAVGYYLNDGDYAKYEALIVDEIKSWLGSDTSILDVGGYIFKGLSGAAHRISQDTLAEICCLFINKHYSRWYIDMFKFIGQHMDLREMKLETAKSLITHIMSVFDDEQERKLIQYSATFLCVLRKQMPEITNELDAKVAEYFPKYYSGVYLLETTENEQQNLPGLVKGYVEEAQKTNATQGQNGVYFGHGTRTLATIRSIFRLNDVKWDNELMDAVITTAADTLLVSKEGIHIKLDAVSLLVCIALKFPEHYNRNKATYDLLREKREEIETADISIISSNVDRISLEIGLCFLYTAMGEDVYLEILDLLPCIQNDIPTTIAVASMVNEYLTSTDSVVLPQPLGTIVLQNVLQWLRSEHLDIRYIATKILLRFSCEPESESVVNRQIINLVDSECIYIKNLIINRIYTTKGIWEKTRDYVVSKCENDECFIVRMVCAEQKKLHSPA